MAVAPARLRQRGSPVLASREAATRSLEEWRELFAFEAPYLQEVLFAERKFSDVEEYRLAFRDLKRHLALRQLRGRPLALTDAGVYEVWRRFIRFAPEYREFCARFFGEDPREAIGDRATDDDAHHAAGAEASCGRRCSACGGCAG